MGRTVRRGMRNVLRKPLRFVLIVFLLGTSLMFVAAMLALNVSAQKRLGDARTQIGTGIDITPAGAFGPNSNGIISQEDVQKIRRIQGVTAISESIMKPYDEQTIKGSVDVPEGVQVIGQQGKGNSTLPPFIQGTSSTTGTFPLFGGVTPQMLSGRPFSPTDQQRAGKVVLTSQLLAKRNGWQLGSQITLKGVSLTLIGIFKTDQPGIGDNNLVLPLKTAQELYKLKGVSSLTAYASSDTEVPDLTQMRTGSHSGRRPFPPAEKSG